MKKQKNNLNPSAKDIKGFIGKDKIVGPKIRLNRKRLKCSYKKEYASLVLFGDLHLGHPGCDLERAKKMLEYCCENNIYVLGMGDYIEAGLRNSVGDSVYMQNLNPYKQMLSVIDLFTPLSEKGLLVGLLRGNHEERIIKDTSVDIVSLMCKMLKISYLGAACWNLFYIGKQSYALYTLHGTSGARFDHTKLKAISDTSYSFNADIVAQGHCHACIDDLLLVQAVDRTRKMVIEQKKFVIISGHYLGYDDSYAQAKGMPLSKMGSPKIKLYGDRRDIHISW